MKAPRAGELRAIAAPFVVARPCGVRIRTRLRLTGVEAAALTAVGQHLGSLAGRDLAARTKLGLVPAGRRERTGRKRGLTAESSSRWAGAITRTSEDQFQLAMRALRADVASLRRAIGTLESRVAAPVGGRAGQARGYPTAAERWQKQRRLDGLRARLRDAEARLAAGAPAVVRGGKRVANVRHNLATAELTVEQWRAQWAARRLFLTADGESGVVGGNLTIRLTPAGRLTVKVPTALVGEYGSHVSVSALTAFSYRTRDWLDRVNANRAVRYDISFDPRRGRWYLDASWGTAAGPPPCLDVLRAHRTLGVDLNADHLACWVVDPDGNPVGEPLTVPLVLAGLPAATRDGRLRAAISALLTHAAANGCASVTVENLNFADARAQGRERMGRGRRGKTFRRTVAGIPTARFRDRLAGMAANTALSVIAVDPAYTSRWGGQHWQRPLNTRTSGRVTVSRHQAAAVVIGRRAHGMRARRRTGGPARDQRIPLRESAVQAELDVVRASSRGAPPHRTRSRTAAPDGHRSGEPRPAHASSTVREASEHSLVLTV